MRTQTCDEIINTISAAVIHLPHEECEQAEGDHIVGRGRASRMEIVTFRGQNSECTIVSVGACLGSLFVPSREEALVEYLDLGVLDPKRPTFAFL